MSFLYPLFLSAGLLLAIPVLIHLFNLRRYKVIFFPNTRFLQNIQLNSRKQSQVRYKWLLLTRILFLVSLILAFAQPFFSRDKKDTGNKLKVIYIDNSYSMSLKKGARSLLDIAKNAAAKQITQAGPGTRFLLLSNDKPSSYLPLPADKVLTEINHMDVSAASKTVNQTLATVQSILQNETATGADLYYYSDYQSSSFSAQPDTTLMRHISFFGVPVQAEEASNIYIDTAYLNSPTLQTAQSNKLVVHTKLIGAAPKESPVLQLIINKQVKSAASLSFAKGKESIDTLSFQVNDANWQQMTLSINDASIRFDDTFRITAHSSSNLAVLVLNEGQPNPYIQAAFRAQTGFRVSQADISAIPSNLRENNLVILNGITRIDKNLGKALSDALLQGQSICIFPGRTANVSELNEGLKLIGDIHIDGVDTASQTASALQEGSSLVKDIFEKIPDNVQLPLAGWHYIIGSGLTANQQSVLSFRNGDPFLARYTPSRGQLYICATSADIRSGNFPGSYFFAPFLYQMAIQSKGGDVYAITGGKQQPVYLSLNNANERNMVHVYGPGLDIIPPQRPSGAGLDVYIDQAVQQPGFYSLAAAGSDTTVVALNQDRNESRLETWNISALRKQWSGTNIKWLDITDKGTVVQQTDWNSFPLWKVCAILALLMLAAETFVLAGSFRKQSLAS